jgi:hypothetical protein
MSDTEEHQPEDVAHEKIYSGLRTRDAIKIGAAMALSLILFAYGFSRIPGVSQERARLEAQRDQAEILDQIRIASANQQRANACSLALVSNPDPDPGETLRDEGETNAYCLIPFGFEPIDLPPRDGEIDTDPADPFPFNDPGR